MIIKYKPNLKTLQSLQSNKMENSNSLDVPGAKEIADEGQSHPVKLGFGGTMETHYLPLYVITGFFAAIFIIVPIFIRKGRDKWIYRACVMMTAFSLWLFWVTIYISQMNPLVGPRVTNVTLAWIAYGWGDPLK